MEILSYALNWKVYLILIFIVIFFILFKFSPSILKLNTYEINSNPLYSYDKKVIGFSDFKFETSKSLLYTQEDIRVKVKFKFNDEEYYNKNIKGKLIRIIFMGASLKDDGDVLVLKRNLNNSYLFEGEKIIKYNIEGFNEIFIGYVDGELRDNPIYQQTISNAIFIAGARDKLTFFLTMVIIALTLITTYFNIIKP